MLVNLDKVKGIKLYERSTFVLVMDDKHGTELQVSERQAKDLRQCLPGL
jgi:DNA-binding LytR/AlgR family response regulator